MPIDVRCEKFDIVWHNVIAAFQGGVGFARQQQRNRGTRTPSQNQFGGIARRFRKAHNVVKDGILNRHLLNLFLALLERCPVHDARNSHLFQLRCIEALVVVHQNLPFCLASRIRYAQLEKKPVQLRFG